MSLMSRVIGARLFRRNKELRRTAVWYGGDALQIFNDDGVLIYSYDLRPEDATAEKVYVILDRYADKGVFTP